MNHNSYSPHYLTATQTLQTDGCWLAVGSRLTYLHDDGSSHVTYQRGRQTITLELDSATNPEWFRMTEGTNGIGRLKYFTWGVANLMALFLAVIISAFMKDVGVFVALFTFIAAIGFAIYAMLLRMRDIGLGTAAKIMCFVTISIPYVNGITYTFLSSAPSGFAQTKKYDDVGWLIIAADVVLTVLMFMLMINLPHR